MADGGYREIPPAFSTHALTAHDCVPLPHPTSQIRVLDLDPDYSDSQDMVGRFHGSLRVISLPSDEDYSALSWVWSQKDPGTSQRQNRLVIQCDACGNQHTAKLRPNLWSALWHLSRKREFLTIWVDAICIDQRNKDGEDGNMEKMHQIPLMRSIYASAHTTYFWLGEAAKGTDEAMDYLCKSKLSMGTDSMIDKWRAIFELFGYYSTFSMPPHQAGLEDILTRPWIERLWTLQECLLSRRGIVICGKKWIAWPDLIVALESIHWFHTESTKFRFSLSYQPWLNLANLSRWFADGNGSQSRRDQEVHQVPEGFDLLGGRIQSHVRCLEYADKILGPLTGILTGFFTASSVLYVSKVHNLWHGYLIPSVFLYGITRFHFADKILGPFTGISRGFFTASAMLFVSNISDLWDLDLMPSIFLLGMIYHRFAYVWFPEQSFKFIFPSTHHSIVQEVQNRKVTNPKDVYYATVGLLGYSSPDADESIDTLHRKLCTGLIEKTKSLELLLLANSVPSDYRTPSWVINWSLEPPQIWGKALHYRPTPLQLEFGDSHRQSNLPLWLRVYTCWKLWVYSDFKDITDPFRLFRRLKLARHVARYDGATPGTQPFWEFRNVGKSLCIHAAGLTRISSVFEPLDGTWRLASVLSDTFSSMDHVDQVRARALLKEFMAVSPRRPVPPKVFDRWWLKILTSLDVHHGREWIKRLMDTDRDFRASDDLVKNILRDEDLSLACCEANTVSCGGPAFAPIGAQKDDIVALVSGVSFPLVLRHQGQQDFRLIGPLFLPEVMQGGLKDVLTSGVFHEIELV